LGPVQQSLGIEEDKQAGTLVTAFFVSYSLFSPLVGYVGDRMPRKYLLAAGVGLWSLATFGCGLAETFGQMLLARSMLGIGEASYATIAPTMIADLFPRDQRSRALAVFYVAIPLGSALGYVLGGQIEAYLGWRWAFYVVGLPGLLVALAALAIREPRRGASEDIDEAQLRLHEMSAASWETYLRLASNRSYVFNTLGMAMMTFAFGGLAAWAPTFLEEVRGMELKQATTWMGAVIVVSGLVGTSLGGWLADRLARRIRGAYFWIASFSMFAAAPFIYAAITASYPGTIFSFMAIGLTLLFLNTGPSNAIIVNVTVPKIRAAAFAINIFFIHLLGDIPSPPLMGWVSDISQQMYWGLFVTIPAILVGGLLYANGARYLEADQEAVLVELRSAVHPAVDQSCTKESTPADTGDSAGAACR
jgi:MFS family permease